MLDKYSDGSDLTTRPDGLVDAPDPAGYYEPAHPPRPAEVYQNAADIARKAIELTQQWERAEDAPIRNVPNHPSEQ